MARSAEDLWLELSVIAGPDAAQSKAYRLELPAPRASSLGGYRLAAWLDDTAFPVDGDVLRVLSAAVAALRAAGASIDEGARPDLTLAEIHDVYASLLNPIMVSGMPAAVHDGLRELAGSGDASDPTVLFARRALASHVEWLRRDERRARYRARFAAFFERYDALLCPVSVVPAIAHDHEGVPTTRRITVNGQARPYLDLLGWSGIATAHYLPATVLPAGRTPLGLPIGLQIIGPYLEDRTTLDVALRASELLGGFVPPDRYA
jgi:amidase